MTASDPAGQAAAFADVLADRIASTGRWRPLPDATPGGPLRMLDDAFGPHVVDRLLRAALLGTKDDHLAPRTMGRADAYARRPATRASEGRSLPGDKPLLTVWRPVKDVAAAARTALLTARQLPGPFAAAADAITPQGPAGLVGAPVTVAGEHRQLVQGPLERLADEHLQVAFGVIWGGMKTRGRGHRSGDRARHVLAEAAGRVRMSLLDTAHDAKRRGDLEAATRFDTLVSAVEAAKKPASPTNPARWYWTTFSGSLKHWAALGCVAADLDHAHTGWIADLVPLPPQLIPPSDTLGSSTQASHRRNAGWWRTRRDALRLPVLFANPDTAGADPHQARTATLTRHRTKPGDDGRSTVIADPSEPGRALAEVLADPDRRTLLVGPPGSGKSDSIRVAAHTAADLLLRRQAITPGRTVIVATAAAVAAAPGVTLLAAAIIAADPTTPADTAADLLSHAALGPPPVVMLDGYDELADPTGRARLLDLIDTADHPVVIATRPEHQDALLHQLSPATVLVADPLGAEAVARLLTGWLHHLPDTAARAIELLTQRPRLAALCTTPLYARLLATALAGGTDPADVATSADLLHAVMTIRVSDPARNHRPLPLTAEETEDRIDAAAAVGLAHLTVRSTIIGSIAAPIDRVRRRDLRPLLVGSSVPAGVLEAVLGGLGIVELDEDGTISWPHQLLGEYLAGRALADLACSPDPTANRRHAATVLTRRAFQPDWIHALALCAGELDRRARRGDPRAPAALMRHRTLLTDPLLTPLSTPAEVTAAAARVEFNFDAFIPNRTEWDKLHVDEVRRRSLIYVAAAAILELAEPSSTDLLLVQASDRTGPSTTIANQTPATVTPTDRGVYLIRYTTAVDAVAEWLRDNIQRATVEDDFSGWEIIPVDGFGIVDVWNDVIAAANGNPAPAIVEAFGKALPAAAALNVQQNIRRCIDATSLHCICWPFEKRTADSTASQAVTEHRGPTVEATAHDWFALRLLDDLVHAMGPHRQRLVHGLLSLVARGNLQAAAGLLGCTPDRAKEAAVALFDDVPTHLHVSPVTGPHPRTLPFQPPWEPPPAMGDVDLPIPPGTGATQFRAAAALLSGGIPDHWDLEQTDDLFHFTLLRRASGLPTGRLEQCVARHLAGPPPTSVDGRPDWAADRARHDDLLQIAHPYVGDRPAMVTDDPYVRHRIMCPAAPHRRWRTVNAAYVGLNQDAVCEAVGHDDDDRWLGMHDRPTRTTILRGFEAARRAAAANLANGGIEDIAFSGYVDGLACVLGQAARGLTGFLSLAADPTLTDALAKVLMAIGLSSPDISDPAAVWEAAIGHSGSDLLSRDEHHVRGDLLLRSKKWAEPLLLTSDHLALIAAHDSR